MIEKIKNSNFLVIILVVFILVGLGCGGYSFYKLKNVKTITIVGTAQAQVANQISSYSVTVEGKDVNKSKAVEKATTKSQEVITVTKTFGIDPNDIITQNLNVYQNQDPYIDNGVTKYKLGDWSASYSVEITLRDLTKSEALTAALVKVESTTMYGPNLRVDDQKIDEASILAKAVDNARAKALKLALASGKKLGEVISIVEGGSSSTIYPLTKADVGMGGGGSGFPIEAGSTTVTKTVTVTFKLE